MTVDDMPGGPPAPPTAEQAGRSYWFRLALPLVTLAAVVVLVVVQRERLLRALETLVAVRWEWLAVAIALELLSMGALARQQSRLLRAGGGQAPLSSVMATTYAGNTISVGLPVAGPAAGTLYTFRRYKELGNEPALVSWVLAVSGVFSTASFALCIAVGCVLVGTWAGILGAVLALVVAVVPAVVFSIAIRNAPARDWLIGVLCSAARWAAARVRRLDAAQLQTAAAGFLRQLGRQRLGARESGAAAGWSLVNWLADAACLGLAIHAVGANVPWQGLLLAWAAGAGAATLGLTPGGVGVVETALIAALVGVTVPLTDAVPAVLVYRSISLWLVFGIGAVLMALPRRAPRERPCAGATRGRR